MIAEKALFKLFVASRRRRRCRYLPLASHRLLSLLFRLALLLLLPQRRRYKEVGERRNRRRMKPHSIRPF